MLRSLQSLFPCLVCLIGSVGISASCWAVDFRLPPPPRVSPFDNAYRPKAPTVAAPVASIYTAKPSAALLKDLHKRLADLEPYSTPTKLTRIEVAARIIQVDLLLGPQGSGLYNNIGIQPEEAQDARTALRQSSMKDLNDLSRPATRQILWSSIGSAHPLYRMYAEAARLAEHADDPRVLDRVLRTLKETWSDSADPKPTSTTLSVFEEWMRDVLLDMLHFQAVSGLEDAARIMRDMPVAPQEQIHRAPSILDPPAREPRVVSAARAGGQLDQFDKLAHLGAALQRSGFEVTFWSVSVFQAFDEETKTVVDEPLLVFPVRADEPQRIAIADEALLAPLGGEQLGEGVYLFAGEDSLQALLTTRAATRVPMTEVLEASSSLTVWSEAIQIGVEKSREEITPRQSLLGFEAPQPWASFIALANSGVFDQPRERFIEQMRRNQAKLQINRVLPKDLVTSVLVSDLASRGEDESLPRHEAVLGRAFQLLPQKMSPGIVMVTLQSKAILEKLDEAVIENGKVVIKKDERITHGRAWAHRIYLATASLGHAVHENVHAWAFARFEKFEIGEFKGSVVDPFNEISWERDGGRGWKRRGGDRIRLEDFCWQYGATNHNEDLAVVGQYYVLFPKHLRDSAQEQLELGNLVPTVKYLYLKYVAFLDRDGLSVEYGLDGDQAPFTFADFERRVFTLEKAQGGLDEEQIRLVELARLIDALSQDMLEKQKLVRTPRLRDKQVEGLAGNWGP